MIAPTAAGTAKKALSSKKASSTNTSKESSSSLLVSPSSSSTPAGATKTSSSEKQRRKSGGTGLNDLFIVIFAVAFVLSLSFNVLHISQTTTTTTTTDTTDSGSSTSAIHQAMKEFKQGRKNAKERFIQNDPPPQEQQHQQEYLEEEKEHDALPIELQLDGQGDTTTNLILPGKLDCQAHGGPFTKEQVEEMIYWQDIPSDEQWVSPFHNNKKDEIKYLTFEPDGGGWNNIRMAMESIIGLTLAMGRTLVMPPQKKMYLLSKSDNKQRHHFSFVDFYPIEEVAQEHAGLNVISMEQYLITQALTGKLRNKFTGKVEFPPGNRTDWNGIDQGDYDILREYLRNVTNTPVWKPGDCLPAFPKSGNHKDVEFLQSLIAQASQNPKEGHPVAVDNPDPLPRLEETLAGRKKLCLYDEELQTAPALHFQCNHHLKIRLLVHFYAFLFFEDWKEDLWMKRFIRDHVRYIDEIQCAAARVVAGVREHARQRDPTNNPDGIFDTFHVRRGDFQFHTTRIPAQEIIDNSKDKLTPGLTIFIATDERDKRFFDPFRELYDIVFLDDFAHELKGVNTNYYGMIDQLVAAKGRIFFGCWFSTFTGYIMRLRGYYSQLEKSPGYENGELLTSYYYATLDKKFAMHTYYPLRGGFFNREFPTSWRDLNKGIGMLEDSSSTMVEVTA